MSKISLKFKNSSVRSFTRRRKKIIEEIKNMRPIDFCCSAEDFDPLMKYDQRNPPYTSSLTAIDSLQESPAIKLRTQYINHLDTKKLITKSKDTQYVGINSEDFSISSINGPIQWYIEDELELAKDILWEDRLRKNEEETRENIRIGKANVKAELKQLKGVAGPRWYQDFSIDQMKNLMMLEDVIMTDYKQMDTGRTQKTLMAMGIVSTFFKIHPKTIRRMQRSCDFKAIDFLREIYRLLTGNYFEQEGYKKTYDCNERIILSAIAFLTLPEIIIELDKRLPTIVIPKFPPKPKPMMIMPRKKASSPYKEELFTRPDWVTYMTRLQQWRNYCKSLPIRKVILPDENCPIFTYKENLQNVHINNVIVKNDLSIALNDSKDNIKEHKSSSKRDERLTKDNNNLTFQENNNKKKPNNDISKLPDDSQIFDFTLSGLSENQNGPVKYKICGTTTLEQICDERTLNPPKDNKKSWLGEKDAHFVISGVSDDPPECPVSYEMTGIANVTPTNSDERFFSVLKLGDGPNKIYPSGRKNLSKNWQEWLQNADEEFIKVEKEANKILKSVEATMRLVFPGPICDSCCSCRQTRKTDIMQKETKTPFMVIDALTEDERKQKYIVGSMALHSPAPSPHQSTVNLIEMIASEDKITTNVVINGVTTDKGEKKYYITGMNNEKIHIPSRRVETPPPLPKKNIPPCSCAIQQMFNQGVTPRLSTDNIPWTKDEGLCFGKKYRPDTVAAYSCKAYPGDKSCRLNPFLKEIVKLQMKKKDKKNIQNNYNTKRKKKRMYSIANFQPCGDEHGMSVCGGPWGTRNILSPKELEELERQRKEILKGPPCGIRPGRAVCEGPFGERIPQPKETKDEDEEDEEEEEEEEEEEKEDVIKQQTVPMKKEKILKRDKLCHASPETIATKKKIVKEKVTKFIPDPDYHGYDDSWNIFRTAPSVKETITEYEQTLKLSKPKPRSDSSQPIREVLKKRKKRKSSSGSKESESFKSSSIIPKEISSKTIDDEQQITHTKVRSDKIKKEKKSTKKMKDIKKKQTFSAMLKKNLRGKRTASTSSKGSRRGGRRRRKRSRTNSFSRKGILRRKDKIKSINNIDQNVQNTKEIVKKKEKNKRLSKMSKVFTTNDGNSKWHKKEINNNKKKLKTELGSHPSTNEFKTSLKNNSMNRSHDEKSKKKENEQDEKNLNTNTIKKIQNNIFSFNLKNVNKKKSSAKFTKASKVGEVKKHHKKKSVKDDKVILKPEDIKQEMKKLKTMMMSPDTYPHNVEPVILPSEPPSSCKHEYSESLEKQSKDSASEEIISSVKTSKKGPCGWRTESEQELPVKKTLAYLVDPDPPIEMIPVKKNGKACVCRENRNKKKILMYQIGGSIGKKKIESKKLDKIATKKKENKEERDDIKIIDGVIYYTPPPSRRRSDEYVPEYDLYESPYEKCVDQRKDSFINLLERYTTPRDVMSKIRDNVKPCDCSGYLDTYGIIGEHAEIEESKRLLKEREKLMESKLPKERWALALKDKGLMDYYAGCKHKVPCWTKCAKFNKYICPLKPRRLIVKKPVCECKYERKIIERKEERIKWKEREKKLKSFKKNVYTNVQNISRPMKADTKLIISDVKRIPRDDEYIDDVQYCISGVAENYSMGPPTTVIEGLNIGTPLHTPEPSKEKIPCVCLHSHWSPTNIPPGPLPKKEHALVEQEKRRKEYLEKAARIIYGPHDEGNNSEEWYRSCKATCEPVKMHTGKRKTNNKMMEEKNENNQLINSVKPDTQKSLDEQKTLTHNKNGIDKNVEVRTNNNTNVNQDKTMITEKKMHKETKKNEKVVSIKRNSTEHEDRQDKDVNVADVNLENLIKKELKKMATEGFLFAKLPKCHRMQQIQNWIMYRKGFVFNDEETDKLLRLSYLFWGMADVAKSPKIVIPSLDMSKKEIHELTFDRVEEMKNKIAMKNAIYYSQMRKIRVLYSRYMWKTMEFRRYPSLSFKKAFFTYMPTKEADGHVFKPWMTNEVREKN